MNASEARDFAREAWAQVTGSPPSAAALQTTLAIGHLETGWGTWTPFGGSHNWGAVQCCKPRSDGTCPEGSFLAGDSKPTTTGQVPFPICFKSYPDDAAGCADLVRQLVILRPSVREVIDAGNADLVALRMYRTHYYGGFGATDDERIAGYAKAIASNAAAVARDLGETLAVHRGARPPASSPPASGDDGALLGVAVFGLLGVGLAFARR